MICKYYSPKMSIVQKKSDGREGRRFGYSVGESNSYCKIENLEY